MTKTKKRENNNNNNSPQSPPSWSELPPELLAAIAQCLKNNRLLNLRFRSVCKSWRSTCPPYNHNNNNNNDNDNVLSLFPISYDGINFKANTVYLVEPKQQQLLESSSSCSQYWIIMVTGVKPGGVFSLRHPLSGFKIGTNGYPKVLNLLDFRVTEIGTCLTSFSSKALMVPSNLDFGFANGLSLAVVGFSDVLRIFNSANRRWKSVPGVGSIDDIVEFNGSICTVDRQGRLFSVSGKSSIHQISSGLGMRKSNRKRLVVSNKDLYLLTPHMDYVRVSFYVYKLCETTGKWIQVRSLRDQVFFIGEDCSFSFSAEGFPGFQRNCIFASADSFRPYQGCHTQWCKYYNRNLKWQRMVGMFHLYSHRGFEEIESSDPFWPPPSWVTSNITSMVDQEIKSRNTREGDGEIAQFESNNDNDDMQSVGALPLEENESRYQNTKAVGHDDCEAIDQNNSKYEAVKGSHSCLVPPRSSCHVEASPSADHIQTGLRIEDFEVAETDVDLLRAVLEHHPQAFMRVNAKNAWMRGWVATPALQAYRLLREGNDGNLSEAGLQNVEDLVNAAEREGVEVDWLRKPLEQAWEYYNRCNAWQRIDELTMELDRLHRLAGKTRPTPSDCHFID